MGLERVSQPIYFYYYRDNRKSASDISASWIVNFWIEKLPRTGWRFSSHLRFIILKHCLLLCFLHHFPIHSFHSISIPASPLAFFVTFQHPHFSLFRFNRPISFGIMRVAILTFGLTVLTLSASGYPLSTISNEGDPAMTSVLNPNDPANRWDCANTDRKIETHIGRYTSSGSDSNAERCRRVTTGMIRRKYLTSTPTEPIQPEPVTRPLKLDAPRPVPLQLEDHLPFLKFDAPVPVDESPPQAAAPPVTPPATSEPEMPQVQQFAKPEFDPKTPAVQQIRQLACQN